MTPCTPGTSASSKCRCPRVPLLRSADGRPQTAVGQPLPVVPDELVEKILSNISPAELVGCGWDRVSRHFGFKIHRLLCKKTTFCFAHDITWLVFQQRGLHTPVADKFMTLLIRKYLCQVEDISIPIALFAYIHSLLERRPGLAATSGTACAARLPLPGVAFTNLTKLTIQIGGEGGQLTLSNDFDNLKIASIICKPLKEVNLELRLADNEDVTCAGFRELVRYLTEIASERTTWNLRLEDYTLNGQVWYGPANLNRHRNKVFISYVRAMSELKMPINRLELIDRRKVSPYMLVMSNNTRRTIYMYPEFKRCRELFVCYDVGLIAPIFSHENDPFNELNAFEVDESHVLYKADLLAYLSNASNLKEIRIVVPATWDSRVSRCNRGCFANPDFACFKAEGWCGVPTKVPQATLAIVGATAESEERCRQVSISA